jgi:hypothetical protein
LLFDPATVLSEQLIMADLLAMVLMIMAFAVLLLPDQPSAPRVAVAGLLLGASAVVRPTTLPLIVFFAAYLLLRRAGWRRVLCVLAGGALPVFAYLCWFAAAHGSFNLSNSNGLFLWSRTMSFANCSVIKPPADLTGLCPTAQPDHPTAPAPPWSVTALLNERTPADYLWDSGAWYNVDSDPGVNTANNKLAMQFAERAIEAQPVDYLKTVGEGVFLTFAATDRPQDYLSDHFTVVPHIVTLAPYMKYWEAKYGHTSANTHVVQPWAFFMFLYQQPVWFPGWVFFAVLLGGLVLLIARWRRGWGRYAGLAWGVAVINLVVPIAAHELDYRYALSAVPFACLALGLAFLPRPTPAALPAEALPAEADEG